VDINRRGLHSSAAIAQLPPLSPFSENHLYLVLEGASDFDRRAVHVIESEVVAADAMPWHGSHQPLDDAARPSWPQNTVCPDMPDRALRDEITEWVSAPFRKSRFVVIDDEDDKLDDLPLFQPYPETGLDAEIVSAPENYLNGGWLWLVGCWCSGQAAIMREKQTRKSFSRQRKRLDPIGEREQTFSLNSYGERWRRLPCAARLLGPKRMTSS
jgi:hypothetical protein